LSKYKQIKINVTKEHHDKLVKLSTIDDVSIASYIRNKLNIDLKNPPKRCISNSNEKIVIHKIDPMLLYHLAKIGNKGQAKLLSLKRNYKTLAKELANTLNDILDK